MSREFVCAVADCFYLFPPVTTIASNDPTGASVFKRCLNTAPRGIFPPQAGSRQGLYIMTSTGTCLAGGFSRLSKAEAKAILKEGWENWKKIRRGESRDVPISPIPPEESNSSETLSLKITYRDLPRSGNRLPTFQKLPNPYNLGRYEFDIVKARKIVIEEDVETLKPLCLAVLKDAVRGQMEPWKEENWKGGFLRVTRVKTDGYLSTYLLQAKVRMRQTRPLLSYEPNLFGKIVYDTGSGTFRDFQLLAVGQRVGIGKSNGRIDDPGPAPMAVAIRMYHGE